MRCLKNSMIDNKHWNMYLLYILLHSISPSIIHNSFLIHFDTQLIDHSHQCRLISRPSSSWCLLFVYYLQLLFFIESMALAGFNWLSLLPWQWLWQINSHFWLVEINLLPCDISILVGATCKCVSTQSNFLCTRIGILLLDLLSYWINHACLFLVNAEVSVYIQYWSV